MHNLQLAKNSDRLVHAAALRSPSRVWIGPTSRTFFYEIGGRQNSVRGYALGQRDGIGLSALEKTRNSATQHPFDAHISLRSPSLKRFGAQHRPALSIEIPPQSCEIELKKTAAAASVKHSSFSSSPRLRQITEQRRDADGGHEYPEAPVSFGCHRLCV